MTNSPQLNKEIKDFIETQLEEKIKTIQIKYLKENFLTRDEFLDAMERMDKRFEAMDKRFEAMDKRFEAMDKRFEAMDKRFEAMQKQMDERFEAMQRQIDKRFERVYERFDNIDLGYGNVVEGLQYSTVKREFKQRGLKLDLQIRQHFSDENHLVYPDTTDVEVDIFHMNPNLVGEASLKITSLDKIRTFIKKIELLEKMYKTTFQRYFFCFKIEETIRSEVKNLLKKYNIELIIPKRL
ncbi:MAG: hypothetical protein ACFFAN_16415 [Promethearchaeota archaeon]